MPLQRELLAKLPKCKIIVRAGVGFDKIDVDACRARGLPVCNVPNYGTTEIADHCIGLLLNLTRGIGAYDRSMRSDLIASYQDATVATSWRLRGKVFGIVGLGRIGTAIARRATALDMDVVFFDPYRPEGHDLATGYRRADSLEDLLAQSDVVSLSVPANAETRGMIGSQAFSLMKKDAILLNIARGSLVDLDALAEALRTGSLLAAGLDVLPQEPPQGQAHALIEAWKRRESWLDGRLILTPHAAFYSPDAVRDMRTFSVAIVMDYLLRSVLRNNVNSGWEAFAGASARGDAEPILRLAGAPS
jgi:D-3-phosphoglycerate dehydrogenase